LSLTGFSIQKHGSDNEGEKGLFGYICFMRNTCMTEMQGRSEIQYRARQNPLGIVSRGIAFGVRDGLMVISSRQLRLDGGGGFTGLMAISD
jgi:hypothetical protein